MLSMKDMNKDWLNQVHDYIFDLTVRDSNIEHWDFLTLEVPRFEEYLENGNDALAFDVKNMGYADYDEIDKAFKKLGYDNLSAEEFSQDIYEICQLDNEAIFGDIESYLQIPFYAMGRSGGHWGVLCEDICKDYLVDVILNEKELWRVVQEEYDDYLRESDSIWDIDPQYVAEYAVDYYPRSFEFIADKVFVKNLNKSWEEIKNQSDYMQTYDYAEYVAEKIIDSMEE